MAQEKTLYYKAKFGYLHRVPGRGLEPPWVTPLAPKASASTISPSRRISFSLLAPNVRPVGIEPTTNRLRVECSTS